MSPRNTHIVMLEEVSKTEIRASSLRYNWDAKLVSEACRDRRRWLLIRPVGELGRVLVFILAVTVVTAVNFSCLTHRLSAMPTYKPSTPPLHA